MDFANFIKKGLSKHTTPSQHAKVVETANHLAEMIDGALIFYSVGGDSETHLSSASLMDWHTGFDL